MDPHPLIYGIPAAFLGGVWLYGQVAWPLILAMAAEEPAPPPLDDPQRDPNWCHRHGRMYPACAGEGGH
ncbi:hypothetical protein [Streptomyces tsukubensis]|uniref:hypothetical protein n=1 Tax=Streptomyces tsukubensis TaxID=83656 RepID=UPI00344B037E